MNSRNPNHRTTTPALAPTQLSTLPAVRFYMNVFTVEEYEINGKKANSWTKIGAAFPHKEGPGFTSSSKPSPSTAAWSYYHPTSTTTATANKQQRNLPPYS